MNPQKLLYVLTKAPYSNAAGQEALDAALIGASFEQDCSLLFVHDGVFQLKDKQDSSDSQLKQVGKAFNALSDFGIENVYVDQLSLVARGLSNDDLMIDVTSLDSQDVAKLITQQFRVFTF